MEVTPTKAGWLDTGGERGFISAEASSGLRVPSLYVTLEEGWGWEEDKILGLLLLEGCWFLKMDWGDAKSVVVGFRRAEGAIFALLDHIELLLLFSSSAAVDEDEDGGGKSPYRPPPNIFQDLMNVYIVAYFHKDFCHSDSDLLNFFFSLPVPVDL